MAEIAIVDECRIFTVPQFLKKHPYMTHGGIRHLIFHEKTNGFSSCIIRIGRRVYIDNIKYLRWVKELQKGGSHE